VITIYLYILLETPRKKSFLLVTPNWTLFVKWPTNTICFSSRESHVPYVHPTHGDMET